MSNVWGYHLDFMFVRGQIELKNIDIMKLHENIRGTNSSLEDLVEEGVRPIFAHVTIFWRNMGMMLIGNVQFFSRFANLNKILKMRVPAGKNTIVNTNKNHHLKS